MICGLVNPTKKGNYVDVVGVYENIIDADINAKAIYSKEDAYAVDLTQYAVVTSCMWDGKPYRINDDGKKEYYPYIPTDSEKISALEHENAKLKEANDELMLVMADLLGGES